MCLAHFVNKVINFRSLCEKMSWMCTYFKTETAVAQNLIDDFFFYFWLSDNLSIRRILSEKNMGVRGNYWKNGNFVCRTQQKGESSHQLLFCNRRFSTVYLFCLCLWLRIIRTSNRGVHESKCLWIEVFMNFLHRYFLTVLFMVAEKLYWRKILCGCFRFIWLWL